MAILKNGQLQGMIGKMRYAQVGDVTVVSEMPAKVHNPKTPKQMEQRIKLNNINSMYDQLKGLLSDNFEGVTSTRRPCHLYRSANLLLKQHVWLPKKDAYCHYCVLSPLVVSNGNLEPVRYGYQDGIFVTDLEIGDLELTPDTGISNLASHIFQHNLDWQDGDRMQILVGKQSVPKDIDYDDYAQKGLLHEAPVLFNQIELFLKNTTIATIEQYMDDIKVYMNGFPFVNVNGKLGIDPSKMLPEDPGTEVIYAFALVHSRKSKTSLRVSRQQFALSGTTLYDTFSSNEMLTFSLKTYDGQTEEPKER